MKDREPKSWKAQKFKYDKIMIKLRGQAITKFLFQAFKV